MAATTMKRPLTESSVAMPSETHHESAFHVYRPQLKRVRVTTTVSNKKEKKRVTFADECTIDSESRDPRQQPLHDQICSQMTEEDRRMLWYQKDELVAAKQHMRDLILHGSDEVNGSDEMSGLQRFGWERSQHKRMYLLTYGKSKHLSSTTSPPLFTPLSQLVDDENLHGFQDSVNMSRQNDVPEHLVLIL